MFIWRNVQGWTNMNQNIPIDFSHCRHLYVPTVFALPPCNTKDIQYFLPNNGQNWHQVLSVPPTHLNHFMHSSIKRFILHFQIYEASFYLRLTYGTNTWKWEMQKWTLISRFTVKRKNIHTWMRKYIIKHIIYIHIKLI